MLLPITIGAFDEDLDSLKEIKSYLKGRKNCTLVFTCSDRKKLPDLVSLHKPAILLMEVIQDGLFNLESFQEIRMKFPGMELIGLSNVASVVWIQKLYKGGAKAFVSKRGNWAELDKVIQEMSAS